MKSSEKRHLFTQFSKTADFLEIVKLLQPNLFYIESWHICGRTFLKKNSGEILYWTKGSIPLNKLTFLITLSIKIVVMSDCSERCGLFIFWFVSSNCKRDPWQYQRQRFHAWRHNLSDFWCEFCLGYILWPKPKFHTKNWHFDIDFDYSYSVEATSNSHTRNFNRNFPFYGGAIPFF